MSNATAVDALPETARRIEGPSLLRRTVANVRLYAIDAGWTTRTPLQTHVVVCGFPRAGTTLLSLMLQVAYPRARAFPKERAGVRIAYRTDRNHPLMISKRPDDVFYVEHLRAIYRRRRPAVKFLLTMRDPRAVLTSVHASKKDRYYVSPARWRATLDRLRMNATKPDCLLIKFEEMVTDIERVQRGIVEFLGQEPEVPFDQFLDKVPPGFRATALNGLRALDAAATSKWRAPQHRERIRTLLQEIPDLPQILIESGYEPDTRWIDDYMAATAAAGVDRRASDHG